MLLGAPIRPLLAAERDFDCPQCEARAGERCLTVTRGISHLAHTSRLALSGRMPRPEIAPQASLFEVKAPEALRKSR